jgi:hypothetical protein
MALGGLGALVKGNAAQGAAGQSAQASLLGAMLQNQMFQQASSALQPFISSGSGALNALSPLIGAAPGTNPLTAAYTKAFQPTMQQLSQTPGYQFTLEQGTNAVNNSMASRGLGQSGNALAAGANYASGLASNTYQQQFNDYWQNNLNAYQQLFGVGQLGATSANSLGQLSSNMGLNISNSLSGAGNALAQGTAAQGGAMGNFLSGLGGLSLLGSNGQINNPLASAFGSNGYVSNALGSMGNGLSSFFSGMSGNGFNGPYGLPSG